LYGRIDFRDPSGTSIGLRSEPGTKLSTTALGPFGLQSVVLADNSVMSVVFTACAYRTGGARGTGAIGDVAKFVRRTTVKQVSGVTTILATETIGVDQLDADLIAAGVAVEIDSPSTGVVRIKCTGAASLNLTWQSLAQMEAVVS